MVIPKTDPYTNQLAATSRLYTEWKKYNGIIIGVDFDDTINDFHEKGFTYPKAIHAIQKAQAMGCTICSWTANADETAVRTKFESLGIAIDYYNTSPVMFEGTPKPYFNLLLDDRAGLGQALDSLEACMSLITKEV